MRFSFKGFSALALTLFSIALVVPNALNDSFKDKLPNFFKNHLIPLGLDLKGGAYILLEVDVNEIKKDKLSLLEDEVRSLLRGDRDKNQKLIQYSNLRLLEDVGQISVNIRDTKNISEFSNRLRDIFSNDVAIDNSGNGNLKVYYTEQAYQNILSDSVDKAIEIVRRRIDSLGTAEVSIQKQGNSRIMVQLPGVDNPERIKELIGKTAKMTFHKVDESVMSANDKLPVTTELLPSFDENDGYMTPVLKRVEISGEHLKDSKPTQDSYGRPAVSTVFDNVGSRQFAKLTRENVGKRFAIVLDGKVLSAPVIQEEIPNGQGIISGSFSSYEQVANLALMLRSGALPAPLVVVEERSVGAGLGSDSIEAGKKASVLGLIFVLISMIIFYGRLGILANVVLILNMLIIMMCLGLFGFVLTLPGIAGLVLTVGMAVDAAIIIFERMRDEYRKGMPVLQVIDRGFDNAFSTIMDSNITTLVSSLLMFQFGSGPVRGFAITLGIGVLVTMYCNIIVLRMLLEFWARNFKSAKLPFKVDEN